MINILVKVYDPLHPNHGDAAVRLRQAQNTFSGKYGVDFLGTWYMDSVHKYQFEDEVDAAQLHLLCGDLIMSQAEQQLMLADAETYNGYGKFKSS